MKYCIYNGNIFFWIFFFKFNTLQAFCPSLSAKQHIVDTMYNISVGSDVVLFTHYNIISCELNTRGCPTSIQSVRHTVKHRCVAYTTNTTYASSLLGGVTMLFNHIKSCWCWLCSLTNTLSLPMNHLLHSLPPFPQRIGLPLNVFQRQSAYMTCNHSTAHMNHYYVSGCICYDILRIQKLH